MSPQESRISHKAQPPRGPRMDTVDALDAQIYDSGINFDYGMYPAIST